MSSNPYQWPKADSRQTGPQPPQRRRSRFWGLPGFFVGMALVSGGDGLYVWARATFRHHWLAYLADATMGLGILIFAIVFWSAAAETVNKVLGPRSPKAPTNPEEGRSDS